MTAKHKVIILITVAAMVMVVLVITNLQNVRQPATSAGTNAGASLGLAYHTRVLFPENRPVRS